MNDCLIAIGIDGIGAEILMQHIPMWMQNQLEFFAQSRELHFADLVVQIDARLHSTLHHIMADFVNVKCLVVLEIVVDLCWKIYEKLLEKIYTNFKEFFLWNLMS